MQWIPVAEGMACSCCGRENGTESLSLHTYGVHRQVSGEEAVILVLRESL